MDSKPNIKHHHKKEAIAFMQFGFKVLFYLSVQTQFTEHFIFSSK